MLDSVDPNQNNPYVLESIEESNYSNKGIESIDDIEHLFENSEKNISINISNNVIETIPQSFYKFINLKYLNLSNNKLKNIDNIRNCVKIETLILAHNEIKVTSSLVFLKVLQSLDLSYNKVIVNEVFIKNFRIYHELLSLKLEGNFGYEFETIKNYCLENLSKLLYLDSYKISNSPKKKYQNVYVNVQANDGQSKKLKKLSEYIRLKKAELPVSTGQESTVAETKPQEHKISVLEKLRKENEALRKKYEKPVRKRGNTGNMGNTVEGKGGKTGALNIRTSNLSNTQSAKHLNITTNKNSKPKSHFKGKAALYNFLYLDIDYTQVPKKPRGTSNDNINTTTSNNLNIKNIVNTPNANTYK